MKILLTHSYFLDEDPKEKLIMKPYVPLGILYISSYLEQHGFASEVFDATFSSFEQQQKEILAKRYDVVAIYTNLMTKLNVIRLIKWIGSQEELAHTKIILGGPEVRHHAENFLKSGAHYVITGEGEQTMLELITALQNKKDITAIDGICFLDAENKFIVTPDRKLLKDINLLPFPDRKKIDFTKYLNLWKQHHGFSMMSVSTMRGCPYTCKWCSRAVYGGTYRRRSPELVAKELLYIKENYNPDMIWFVDDVFTIHHRWLKEFAEQIQQKNAIIPYEIISRSDRLNEEVLQLLKESGCARIWIGAESGSQKIIDAMDRRVDVMETRQMIVAAKKAGIKTGTFIMLGYPGETKEDIRQTIEHLSVSDPDDYTITVAYPIKGTPLHNEIENKIITAYNFETNTDRDLDFKRLYPKKYYQLAVQWVQTEVYRRTKERNAIKLLYLYGKSMYIQTKMFAARFGSQS